MAVVVHAAGKPADFALVRPRYTRPVPSLTRAMVYVRTHDLERLPEIEPIGHSTQIREDIVKCGVVEAFSEPAMFGRTRRGGRRDITGRHAKRGLSSGNRPVCNGQKTCLANPAGPEGPSACHSNTASIATGCRLWSRTNKMPLIRSTIAGPSSLTSAALDAPSKVSAKSAVQVRPLRSSTLATWIKSPSRNRNCASSRSRLSPVRLNAQRLFTHISPLVSAHPRCWSGLVGRHRRSA